MGLVQSGSISGESRVLNGCGWSASTPYRPRLLNVDTHDLCAMFGKLHFVDSFGNVECRKVPVVQRYSDRSQRVGSIRTERERQ